MNLRMALKEDSLIKRIRYGNVANNCGKAFLGAQAPLGIAQVKNKKLKGKSFKQQ